MSIPPPPGPPQPQGSYQPPYPRGPYGPQPPHGQPYRPWTQGYSPYNRPAPVNGLAVASLVFGVLCCLPGVGLALGLIALRQIRRRGERGTGLATGGAVLSAIGLALWGLLLGTGGASAFWEGVKESARDGASISLVKGECFDAPGGRLAGESRDLDVVPCSGGHDGEVFASFRLKDGPYPGEESVGDTAGARCYVLRDDYAMDGWAVPDDVDVYYLTPTEDSWSAGDREVTCLFGSVAEGAGLTGSLRNDETVLDADQVAYLKAAHLLDAALATAPDSAHVEDDLPGHKAWAGRMSAALDRQARLLRGRTWPAGARGPVRALAAHADRARAEWTRAARAKDADAFHEHYDAGLGLLDLEAAVPARTALGLAATPPAERGEGGATPDGPGAPGGSGGTATEV
ncbi:DUF4190 domain-containing protein [Streptomyces sp. IBSBF 3136]|uniref:DUF4190 domain-containing protein n=1 Tax=Streptomyces sp. IBSBF 3136 TaxID=2903524 RepID=UPI002FDC4EC7